MTGQLRPEGSYLLGIQRFTAKLRTPPVNNLIAIQPMSKYLLTCECGKKIPVDVGQAGGSVTCSCGAQLDVPALRNLRNLPLAQPEAARSRPPWNASKGFTAAGLIVAALLAAYALWNRFTEPTVPKFDPEYRINTVNEGLEKMSPVEAWQLWVQVYQPLAKSGFAVFEHPHAEAIEQHIARRRTLQTTLLIAAAICACLALTAALWPRTKSRA